MKIILGEFRQETNSFSPIVCSMEYFEKGGIFENEQMLTKFVDLPCQISGMVNAIRQYGFEVIPSVSMRSQSMGPVDHKVVDVFLEKMFLTIKKNKNIGGIFLSLHGATQTTQEDDGAGYIIEAIRDFVHEKVVISVSVDLHANITRKMMGSANIICSYLTYPHTDYFDTGFRAADLGCKCILQSNKLKMVGIKIPMICPASGYTTISGPFANLHRYAQKKKKDMGLVDYSICMMQPWLDVSEGGNVIIAVANNQKAAEEFVVDISKRLFKSRRKYEAKLCSVDNIIDISKNNKSDKPVVLIDSADSTNAGAAGDSPSVITRLLERQENFKTACVINDREAVDLAFKIGVGKSGNFSIGAKKDPERNTALETTAYVKSLHDGIFIQEGPAERGLTKNIGRTAVLQIKNIDLIVCEIITGNGDPQLFRAFGIEPAFYRLLVVKANTSFKVAYKQFTNQFYLADTNGAASSNLLSFNFKKLPRPIYPLDEISEFQGELIIAESC